MVYQEREFYLCSPEPGTPYLYDVYAAAVDKFLPCPHIERIRSDICSIELVIEGSGDLQVNDRHYELRPGDAFILHFNEHHSYQPHDPAGWRKPALTFRHGFISQALQQLSLDAVSKISISPMNLPFIVGLFRQIYMLLQYRPDGYYEEMTALITRLLVALAREVQLKNVEHSVPAPLSTAIRFAETHLHENVNVTEMARAANCSRTHLTRLFKKHIGTSTCKWLNETKMRYARLLLNETTKPIHVIGEEVGFVDPYQFSATFHRVVGMSPSQYRKKYRSQSFKE